ncbi:phosphatidylinositol phospholipase C, delta [Entomortierella parvispora]|uniref:Phosphoinositide phospholipase C n=1 Tax=Entomortierella parvispora TaxID=205924 RepID=A0A9P3HJH1_9FUNG|nr:phosphatidylinositol phospholipase C, delta [Entomortierella parvispora]
MFDKIKRAISGWGGQDPRPQSPQLRPSSPALTKKELGLKASNSLRNSLPARFRNSVYRHSSSSSEVLPLPLPTTAPIQDMTSTTSGNTVPISTPLKHSPSRAASFPIPAADTRSSYDSRTTAANSLGLETEASSPKSSYIRRTSSFQSQRASAEKCRGDEEADKDIIIFSSTPPVTFAPSSSMKVPRPVTPAGVNLHKESPDPSLGSLQETPVVQWPRGGSSAANRSQEHFLRTHRRTSTSSDASVKDLQTQIATTPPISSVLRPDPQRPSLDRQHSRSGVSPVIGSVVAAAATAAAAAAAAVPVSGLHRKTPSDASAESMASTESHGAVDQNAAGSSPAPDHVHPITSHSLDGQKDMETVRVTPQDHGLPMVNPAVAKQLAAGTQMLKISAKKQHSRLFKLDLEQGRILWDSRKFGRINVEQIKELRKGRAARMYREQLRVKPEHEERWLTIIYSAQGKYKALHLVAPTKDTYQDWIMAVEKMWSVKREDVEGLPQLQRRTNQWLKEHWMDADKNVDSKLGYEEVVRLCHRLNINFSRKEIRLRFDQADEKKQGFLDFADFTHFVKLLKERKEVIQLFNEITSNNAELSQEQFEEFMIDTQKSDMDKSQLKDIYSKHIDKTLDKFTVDSFTSFLLSVDNSVVSPKHAQVHQDMTQTLSNYYISSSHNTYLLGHQLTGVSSIEGYIRALQSGCRCVELDCWDGSDGQPVIYHGRTLTSKILFRDVIEAISTYAFVNSPYPLILSLEIHCDLEQQETMANIMKTKLGSWLIVAPLPDSNNSEILPSPDELKFKILIKSKVLPPDSTLQEYSTDTDTESERESESDSDSVKQPHAKQKTKKVHIARALSNITVYCQSRHFPGFTHDGCSPFKIISFSERVSLRLGKSTLQEYINLNKTHLTRVYPAGFRINSTNYDPHHHWAAGCQIVALNYQNHDRGMQMNSAMFTMNGHCGYVLKPQPLRLGPGEVCNHDKAPAFTRSHPVDVTIDIISAQQLPRPNESLTGDVVDPLCEVEMLIPGQSAVKFKTRHINDNGFNPLWNEQFKFRVDYEHHELVFFRFVVEDEDIKFSDLIASYTISLDCLQEGYRHIQLQDPSGDPYLYSTLFIKVTIEPACVGIYGSLARSQSMRSRVGSAVDSDLQVALVGGSRSSTESSHERSSVETLTPPSHVAVPVDSETLLHRPLPLIPQQSPLDVGLDLPPLPPTPPPKS